MNFMIKTEKRKQQLKLMLIIIFAGSGSTGYSPSAMSQNTLSYSPTSPNYTPATPSYVPASPNYLPSSPGTLSIIIEAKQCDDIILLHINSNVESNYFFQVIAQLHRHIHRQVHLITVRHRHATLPRVQITGTFYMHILFISSHQLCTVHMYCCIYCDSFHVANFDRIIFIIYFDIYKYSLSINKLLLKICYSPTSPNYSPTSPNYFSPATNTPGKFFVDSNSLNSQEKSINSNSFC